MTPLDSLLAAILAVRDTPAVRELCVDCHAVLATEGERAAILHAEMLLAGVRAYMGHEFAMRPFAAVTSEAGQVLGTRVPPTGGCWWTGSVQTKTRLKPVVVFAEAAPEGAAYWATDGSGWWRIPEAQAKREAA